MNTSQNSRVLTGAPSFRKSGDLQCGCFTPHNCILLPCGIFQDLEVAGLAFRSC